MNIFISANDRYIYPAQVMLTSFFHHNSDEKHSIFFMYSSVTKENIRKLEEIVQRNDSVFTPIWITETEFNGFGSTARFPVEVYYRFLIPSLLAEEDRALWLDVDMVINHSLKDLYNLCIDDCVFAACESIGDHSYIMKALGHQQNTAYINSGVILFNIKNMRRKTTQDYLNYYIKHKESITWFDQDILNGMFAGQIKVLSNEMYNVQVLNGRFPARQYVTDLADRAAIVHFIGHYKPWQKEYTNPCAEIWDRYHAITFGCGEGYILKRRLNRWMMRWIWIPFRSFRGRIYGRFESLQRLRNLLRGQNPSE